MISEPKNKSLAETSHICIRFAEEIKSLRTELLTIKNEKHAWLMSNQLFQNELSQKCAVINALQLEVSQLTDEILTFKNELSGKESNALSIESLRASSAHQVEQMKSKLANSTDLLQLEKKRVKLLTKELKHSVEDELALRSYCLTLEKQTHNDALLVSSLREELRDAESKRESLVKELAVCTGAENSVAEGLRDIFSLYLASEIHGTALESKDALECLKSVRAGVKRLRLRLDRTAKYVPELLRLVRSSYEDVDHAPLLDEWELLSLHMS